MAETTTARQVMLGLRPYCLIEMTDALGDGEFKVSLSHGGGLGVDNVRDLLESVLESLLASTPDGGAK